MRAVAIASLIACLSVAHVDQPTSAKAIDQARAVVRDLQRIVVPSGIDESFKTRIGGIDQWLNVRGQDRDNPVIHGGPASPPTPTIRTRSTSSTRRT